MSDNTQHAIVVQTCAKIAAEILIHAPIADCEGTLGWWKLYFHEVLDEVTAAIGEQPATTIKSGRAVPVLRQDEMQMKLDEYTAKAGSAVLSDSITSDDIGFTNPIPVKKIKRGSSDEGLTIKGSPMAPPEWLSRAAAGKGVTEVFDNRPNKSDNPKRPDFVSTGPDKTGFWAPKER
jgi:hypothetical protein